MEGAPSVLVVEVNALKEERVMSEAAPPNTVTAVGDPMLANDFLFTSHLRGIPFFVVVLPWTVDWHLVLKRIRASTLGTKVWGRFAIAFVLLIIVHIITFMVNTFTEDFRLKGKVLAFIAFIFVSRDRWRRLTGIRRRGHELALYEAFLLRGRRG